jgi:hypothetical protein
VAIIATVATIVVAVSGLIPKSQILPTTPAHNVETSGGVAAGHDIRDTTITITASDHFSRKNTSMAKTPIPKWWSNPTIIAAFIVAVGGIIAVLIQPILKPKTPPVIPAHNVETSGGVAAGRDIHGNTITITSSDQQTAPAKKPGGN